MKKEKWIKMKMIPFLTLLMVLTVSCSEPSLKSIEKSLTGKSFTGIVVGFDSKVASIGFENQDQNIVENYGIMLSSEFRVDFEENQFKLSTERFHYEGEWIVLTDSTIVLKGSIEELKATCRIGDKKIISLMVEEAFVINDTIKERIDIYQAKGIEMQLRLIK